MTKPALEVEQLVDALRADLPSDADRERARARLLAAGVAVTASVATSSAAATAAALGGSGAAAAGGAKAGLLSQLAGLSLTAKVSMLTTLVAVSVALPIATTRMHEAEARQARAAAAAKATHARHANAARSVAQPAAQPEPVVQRAMAMQLDAPAAAEQVAAIAVAPAAVATTSPLLRMHAAARTTPRARTPQVVPVESAPENAAPAAEPAAVAAAEPATVVAAGATVAPAPAVENEAPAMTAPAASVLRDEADLLDRALSALREGDRTRARQALALHAQRYAHGALEHERERILQRVEGAPVNP